MAGDTITLFDGTRAVGTATVGANGAWAITSSTLAAGAHSLTATQASPAGNTASASAPLALTIDHTSASSTSFVLGGAKAPVAMGITLPSNPNYAAAQLAISVTALPTDGTVTLADGAAAAVGQALTGAQLTSLLFTPAAGSANQTSSFVYAVSDPAGDSSTGTVTLTTGGTPLISTGSQIPNTATPTIAGTALPGSPVTLLNNGVAIGAATADAGTGAYTVTATAPLTLGLDRLTVSTVLADGSTSASAPLVVFDVQAPAAGTSTTDFSSADIGNALQLGAKLAFVGGTEAVQLTDATLSVGPDTGEATIQRLYEGLLGRGNDTGGISYYDAQLINGTSKAAIADQIMTTTPEYAAAHGTQTDQQFVAMLYQNLLGRSAAADPGSSYWTGLLAQGASRGAVAVGMTDIAEAKTTQAPATALVYVPHAPGTLAHELYETGLGREVELPALGNFDTAYAAITPAAFAAQISASAEFAADHAGQGNAAYVNSLYQAGLGRAADAGASYWTGLLNNGGASRADVLLGIATTPEAAAHLTYDLKP